MNNIKTTVECKYCYGSGSILDGLLRKPCPACGGVGQVTFYISAGSELIDCRYCHSSGSILDGLLRKLCPICRGIGKVKVNTPPGSELVECKYCYGSGSVLDGLFRKPCPTCKGIGVISPKIIDSDVHKAIHNPKKNHSNSSRKFEYDIAISFAGEDRSIARSYAKSLVNKGLNVFFDEYMEAELWGEDLYTRLDDIYRNKARYCVLFISQNYAKKLWTNHELKSAQARAFRENQAYILPVKLDDTTIPGIRETTGYVDLRKYSIDYLIQLTLKKIQVRG